MNRFRSIPKVLKINEIDGYEVSLFFSNGENRIVDFYDLLNNQFALEPGRLGYELIADPGLFKKIRISGNWIFRSVEPSETPGGTSTCPGMLSFNDFPDDYTLMEFNPQKIHPARPIGEVKPDFVFIP